MKQICFIVLLIAIPFITFSQATPQSLTLDQIISLHSKDVSDINDFLLTKGWDFEKSSPETDDDYETVTWSFSTNHYSSMGAAAGFVNTYTSSGYRVKTTYQCSDPKIYSTIKAKAASYNMKKVKSGTDNHGDLYSDFVGARFAVRFATSKDYLGNRRFIITVYDKDYYTPRNLSSRNGESY